VTELAGYSAPIPIPKKQYITTNNINRKLISKPEIKTEKIVHEKYLWRNA
jgi:hypothetical protein